MKGRARVVPAAAMGLSTIECDKQHRAGGKHGR
jgi:hypothetical protein